MHAKALVSYFGDAASVFRAKKKELEEIEGIGSVRAKAIRAYQDFSIAEKEIGFIEKYKISPLFITDKDYPQRLVNCYDSPVLLYYCGNADLNTSKIIGLVGTRSNNEYGKAACEKFVADLAGHDILIVSGLAFGIDTLSHKAALKHDLKTVGVLAHGLDRIYPPQNKGLAKEMINNGGLLTDFKSDTNPDKQNFPKRNRIVAGLCDAVIVVQTGFKGGSLITAEIANGYNKDVYAFPGRAGEAKSEGCNYLIKTNKAGLIESAADLLANMGWRDEKKPTAKKQRELFVELSAEEKKIFEVLKDRESVGIDEVYLKSGLSSSQVAAALLTMEINGVIYAMPGKQYKLI